METDTKTKRGNDDMAPKTLTATYKDGSLELPEKLSLAEGEMVTVTIHDEPTAADEKRRIGIIRRARGSWKGEIDGDAFITHIRERRLVDTRPEPKL